MLGLEARLRPSRRMLYITPLLALALTLVGGMVLFAALGIDPLRALWVFFILPVADSYGQAELLLKSIPLILIGVGLAIGFRAGVWNIGAEGQLTAGAIGAGGLAIALPEQTAGIWVLPTMLLFGVVAGMAWAAIPALLKTRYHASEILTSLMLTYVATLLLSYLVQGPWRDPDGFNFPESRLFDDAALLPLLWPGTRLHIGAPLALLAALLGWVLLGRTILGFQLRVIGQAAPAAAFAGFNSNRLVWVALLLTGGLAGLAGMLEVAGPIGQLHPVVSPGYGFTAIIVAFVGRLHPLGVIAAGLLLALSFLGGEALQIEMGLPAAVTGVFQGLLLFFLLACDVLIGYRIVWRTA